MRRVVKRALIIIPVVLLFLFFARRFFFELSFQRISSRIESRGFHLVVAAKNMTGLAGVELSNLVVLPAEGDTLLKADSVYLRPSLLNLLIGRLKLSELKATSVQ